jgi:hypothetical protein
LDETQEKVTLSRAAPLAAEGACGPQRKGSLVLATAHRSRGCAPRQQRRAGRSQRRLESPGSRTTGDQDALSAVVDVGHAIPWEILNHATAGRRYGQFRRSGDCGNVEAGARGQSCNWRCRERRPPALPALLRRLRLTSLRRRAFPSPAQDADTVDLRRGRRSSARYDRHAGKCALRGHTLPRAGGGQEALPHARRRRRSGAPVGNRNELNNGLYT